MVSRPSLDRIPVNDAINRFLTHLNRETATGSKSVRTVNNYAADLADFARLVGPDTILDDVTADDISDALATFAGQPDRRYTDPTRKPSSNRDGTPGRAKGSIRRFRASISVLFGHAERRGWVELSPMPDVTRGPSTRKDDLRASRRALTADQATALFVHGPAPDRPEGRPHEQNHDRDKVIIGLLLFDAPRVSELVGADRADFTRTKDGTVWTVHGKGGKVRRVPLPPLIADAWWLLDTNRDTRWPNLDGDPARAAFLTGRGNRMTARDVQRLLNRATKRVLTVTGDSDLARPCTPHALRHTTPTILVSEGWNLKVVQELLGHENIATTGHYLDGIPGEVARAVAANPALPALTEPPGR